MDPNVDIKIVIMLGRWCVVRTIDHCPLGDLWSSIAGAISELRARSDIDVYRNTQISIRNHEDA